MRIANSTAIVITVALTILLVLSLLVPMPERGRQWGAVSDFAHVPIFALFAALLMWGLLRRWKRNTVALSIVVWLGVAGFGLLTDGLAGKLKPDVDPSDMALG